MMRLLGRPAPHSPRARERYLRTASAERRRCMAIPHEPAFEPAEYAARLATVRRGMAQRELDGLLLFSPHNIFYLSGMDSENLFDFQCLIVPADDGVEPVLVILDFEEARAANSVGAGRTVSYHAFDDPIEAVLSQVDALALSEAR